VLTKGNSMNKQVHLKKFKTNELIFNEEETIVILKFIFKNQHNNIDLLNVTDPVREFAQALLVEAVDSSYAFGFVDALFRSVTNPRAGVKKVLTKFGKKALKHWFKHAKAQDLMSIKIYDKVRGQLAWKFGRVLLMHVNGVAKLNDNHLGMLAFNSSDSKIVWG